MTFHSWEFRCWVFRRWVFEAYYREYPTRVGHSRRWVFQMLGIPYENPYQLSYSAMLSIFFRPTSFLQKNSCRVSSEKNILNSSVEWSRVEWKNWIKAISLFTFSHIFCLLSILSYEARMIIDIHTCVIRKSQSLTYCFLFININTVTRGAHDIRTCVLWEFLSLTYCVV